MELITNPDSNSDEFALVMSKDDLLVLLGTIGYVYDKGLGFELARKVGMSRDIEWAPVAFSLAAVGKALGLVPNRYLSDYPVEALAEQVKQRRPHNLHVTQYNDTWTDPKIDHN